MSRNAIHTEILEKCKELHDAKSHDYAQDDNVFSNFEYAARVAEPFTDPVDKVFVTMIAIKLARLAELRKGKTPKHESIGDTLIDNVNYNAIWASRVIGELRDRQNTEKQLHANDNLTVKMDGSGNCTFSQWRCNNESCQHYNLLVDFTHKHSYSK